MTKLDYEKVNRKRKYSKSVLESKEKFREHILKELDKQVNRTKDRRFVLGKYKGRLVRAIIKKDLFYIDWVLGDTLHTELVEKVLLDRINKLKLTFGKYRGYTLASVYIQDSQYFDWCKEHDVLPNLITFLRANLFGELDDLIEREMNED